MAAPNLKIIVVEDEVIVAEGIAMVLEELGHEVVGRYRTAEEAYQVMKRNKPDFAVLDIHLHGPKNGIWLAKMIRQEIHIPFIFLSAHGDRATVKEAVTERPYGYLMKPFEKIDMYTAIEVAFNNFNNSLLAEQRGSSQNDGFQDGIFIKHGHALRKIKFGSIQYVQADGNYLRIITPEQHFTTKGSMAEYEEKLPDFFLRVHRSFIVNSKKIESIKPKFVTVAGNKIPVSGAYREALMEKLVR